MQLKIEQRIPTPEEYNYLRRLAEWPVFDHSTAEKGLLNSLFSICVINEMGTIVGMGRVVGDNSIYFHIQDVIVDPAFQKKGIGNIIMKELMEYIEKKSGKNSMVGLMCAKGKEEFYLKYGFIIRPNEKVGPGMSLTIS